MGLGKSLFGMFVEIDESDAAASVPPVSSAASAPATGHQAATPKPAAAPAPATLRTNSTADDTILAKLRQTLQASNRPGFDFLEFQASLAALEKVVPDEAIRYRSAFATASTMGVTVTNLLESAQFYRDLLKKESEEFEREMQQRQKNSVGDKQTEIESLKKSIQGASETIQRLTAEIADNQSKMGKLQGQIEDASAKLSRAKERFEASVQHVDSQILQQQKQIQSLLGQGA